MLGRMNVYTQISAGICMVYSHLCKVEFQLFLPNKKRSFINVLRRPIQRTSRGIAMDIKKKERERNKHTFKKLLVIYMKFKSEVES